MLNSNEIHPYTLRLHLLNGERISPLLETCNLTAIRTMCVFSLVIIPRQMADISKTDISSEVHFSRGQVFYVVNIDEIHAWWRLEQALPTLLATAKLAFQKINCDLEKPVLLLSSCWGLRRKITWTTGKMNNPLVLMMGQSFS